MRLVFAGELTELAVAVLVTVGAPQEVARVVARSLVRSNLLGHDSHGVRRLPAYVADVRAGRVHPAARPEVEWTRPGSVVVHGRRAFGQLSAGRAVRGLRDLGGGVAVVYATYSLTYITRTLDLERWVGLTGVIMFTVIVIASQPLYGALSDRIGRRPLNLFSVVFTAVWAFPFFLLLDTREPGLIWLAMIVATAVGFAPMIAVQPAFYAELFGARVRYTGFAASREIGAALGGFSPLIAAALVARADGKGWLVACWVIFTAVVSFAAFYFSKESKDMDIGAER